MHKVENTVECTTLCVMKEANSKPVTSAVAISGIARGTAQNRNKKKFQRFQPLIPLSFLVLPDPLQRTKTFDRVSK